MGILYAYLLYLLEGGNWDLKTEKKTDILEEKKSEVKARFLSLIRSYFFLVVAVVALIAAAIAWFFINKTVTTESSTISAQQFGFELGSDGEEISPDLETYLDDSVLCWRLQPDSNLQNLDDQFGIRPNSSGKLSFYVIPHADGPLSIDCTLDIRPVMKNENDTSDTAAKILRGHLLFACEYTYGGNAYQELVDVRNGTFQINLPDATAGQRQKITLNWFWPYTLHDANNHAIYGSEISEMTGNQEYSDYFYYDGTASVNVDSSFKILNQYYNDADQLIGDKVEAVVLELTAEPASS